MSKRITSEQSNKKFMNNGYFYTEIDYIYSDIVNNRRLSPIAFFKYLHDNYESINYIKSMIKEMENNSLILYAYNIKLLWIKKKQF